jgi:hypothetical protein
MRGDVVWLEINPPCCAMLHRSDLPYRLYRESVLCCKFVSGYAWPVHWGFLRAMSSTCRHRCSQSWFLFKISTFD